MQVKILAKHPQLRGSALEHGFSNGIGQILTLHALARRMLVFYDDQYAKRDIAPDWKVRSLIEKKVEDLKWTHKDDQPVGYKGILWWIDKAKSSIDQDGELIPLTARGLTDFYGGWMSPDKAQKLATVAVYVQEELKRSNLWCFSDLLRECEWKMKHDSDFRAYWSKRFSHILIDETQDSSAQIMRIVGYFENVTLFVVGDPDQTLYKFLGASPDVNMRAGFDNKYGSNGQRLVMNRCFRCQPVVLLRADNLIQNNYTDSNRQFYKKLESKEGAVDGPDLSFNWYSTPEDEAAEVVREIADQIDLGELTPGDVFVLSRVNAQLAPIEIELLRRGIAFVNLGMSSFFSRQIPKIVVGYMRLCVERNHWPSFETIYNVPSEMFESRGKYTSTRYLGREFLDKMNRGVPDLIAEAARNKAAVNKKGWQQWANGVMDIESTFLRLREYTEEHNASSFIAYLRDLVLNRWMEEEFGLETDASESVRDDLAMLNSMAGRFTIKQFLSYVAQLQATKQVKPENLVDYVLIGTGYRAKGLERKAVWGIGWSDRLFPHKFNLGEPVPSDGLPIPQIGTVEDERCLAYVIVTRAIFECHLSGVASWPTIREPLEPSRFISEMGLSLPSQATTHDPLQEEDIEGTIGYRCDECGEVVASKDDLVWSWGRYICAKHPDYIKSDQGREDENSTDIGSIQHATATGN